MCGYMIVEHYEDIWSI